MARYFDSCGLPVGKPVPGWIRPSRPSREVIPGISCELQPLTVDHADDLWNANSTDQSHKNWVYLPYGPFETLDVYREWVRSISAKNQPLFYAIIDHGLNKAVGVSSFDFIDDVFGSIEIGHLNFSPLMQRSLVSSEAVIVMIRKAFELGFRRVAWRCHSLNSPSISAAKRFGFKFEAFFKYYSVMKGHNRNNLWYSIVKDDWPELNETYTKWLESGSKEKLGDLTKEIRDEDASIHEALFHSVPDYQHRLLALKDPVGDEVLGKPVGELVESWKIPPFPSSDPIVGESCRVERLSMKHCRDLFEAYRHDKNGSNWTYLTYGPFTEYPDYEKFLSEIIAKPDPFFHAVIDQRTNKAVGVATFMEINPVNGSIEIGHINFSPLMQRTIMSSEAIIMMAKKAFEWGYRRLEWKCHSLNARSVSAAKRYGFNYEGVFRSVQVMKGNNRDTAWFSITLDEWPGIQETYDNWLKLAREGKHTSLSAMMVEHKKKCFNGNQ